MRTHARKMLALAFVLAFAGGCGMFTRPGVDPPWMARYHWDAVASNDLGMTMFHYTPASTLEWVGGPLQGKYSGTTALAEVWTKFFYAQGYMNVEVSNVQARQEGARHIVTARTIFKGRQVVPVDYALVFEGDRVVAETWKVSP